MVQGYYTLEEAARILGMDTEKLSQMARKHEIRGFADRGKWQFRTQDIEEMARRLGMGSNPDIQLGEASPTKAPAKPPADEGFDFSLEGEGTEHEIIIDSPSSSKIRPAGLSARPTTPRPVSPKSPSPKPGSDSDVHLVFDVTEELPLLPDSDVKIESGGPKSGPKTPRGGPDSGVRLVPMEDDRGAPSRRPTPSDSDIRLEPTDSQRRGTTRIPARAGDTSQTTEEVNLDAELGTTGRTPKPQSKRPDPRVTPVPKSRQPSRTSPPTRKDSAEDEVSLGDLEGDDLTGVSSGINLHSPADSGINLAKPGGSDDSLEFELTLDQESTPRPKSGAKKKDSSGEFELTLDEGGAIAPVDKDEKDIFETDFDMPALDDESGSEAVALEGQDTDLESSDFDLALGDEESGSQVVALDEDEADEGAATAVAKGRRRRAAAEDEVEEIDDLLVEDMEDVEDEDEVAPRRLAPAAAAPANWGALPAAILAPCIVIMFIVGIMSFELLHSMWGYKQPYRASGFVTKTIAGWFNEKLPE